MKKYFLSIISLLLINLLAFAQEDIEPAKVEEITNANKSKNVIIVGNRWEITLLKAYNTGKSDGMYKASYTVRDSKYNPQTDEERKYRIAFIKITTEKNNVYPFIAYTYTNWKTFFQDKPQKDIGNLIWSGAPGNIKKFIFIEGALIISLDGIEMKKPFSAEIDLEVE